MGFMKEHLIKDDLDTNKKQKRKRIRYINNDETANNNLKSNPTNGKSKPSTRSRS